ncbi:hypothetical protein KM176_04110 [Pseudooceanicola sp. CBS1P-1]|uniref:Uncharacterized protein n=1 Tax=Pseudooceanicola albus TaxID=2692189 RepID=A0A6L7G754_9RHOB|nr:MULTISPECIES: hypothetical protein [Pseudooceanicola]MBT9383038.1 hypothetical protein [Pseudooceanicola endophyticus]MXN19226.1 hypothetical protein [Pseudooceanicola albus]
MTWTAFKSLKEYASRRMCGGAAQSIVRHLSLVMAALSGLVLLHVAPQAAPLAFALAAAAGLAALARPQPLPARVAVRSGRASDRQGRKAR